ncbi:divergent polysaccharide deacetylase family protein [uncultured Cohaesibacter sp.]|uniref:divergent polysaccharide deacetylase family protein n=1 Tax=uncultured Cohaesibacter sp. TaxID=1002546 RepID=UPI0029C91995|nr:divergent polysaccharide deacetylase family protein [uncultured Cohaesibacter sp.]
MAANDLKKPLGQEKKTPLRNSQIFMLGSLAALAVLVTTLASWIFLVDDPHGGYATKKVDLSGTLNSVAQIGVEGIRPGIKPGIPETNLPETNLDGQLDPDAQTDGLTELTANDPNTADNGTANSGEVRVLDPSDPSLNSAVVDASKAPYRINAREVNSDAIAGLPKISVIVDGLGLSQTTTQEALSLLAPDITLAFAPYGNSLARWTRRARAQGHELLVQVPMEPFDYPNNDPGPHTLLTSANAQANKASLNWVLGRFDEYVGVVNYMGARFSTDEMAGSDFMREMKANGLMYVETGASGRSRLNSIASDLSVPNLRADLVIDARGRAADIETRLIQLETIAQDKGVALGVASAYPISIRIISEWTQSLRQRGFALVPVTTLLQQ